MTAKDSLAHSLNVAATLNSKLTILTHEYASLQQRSDETNAMATEEILSIRCVLCF